MSRVRSAVRAFWPPILVALSVLAACDPVLAEPDSGQPLLIAQKDAGGGVDAGKPDSGTGTDPGDAGRDGLDAAVVEPVDAATADDAGTPIVDSGTPPVDSGVDPIDSGTLEPVDSGQPRVDAGTVDAGSPVVDSGVVSATDAGPPKDRDAGAGECPSGDETGASFTLRAMAANLTSGNLQSYTPGNGQKIMQGVKPDVVMLQEFNIGSNSDADFSAFANSLSKTDAGMYWSRGPTAQIPNGIISRWPITEAGNWADPKVDNRGFAWAHIDLPGPRDLWVVSLHLLTSSAADRNAEGVALIAKLQAVVPATDFLLIGGDFNTNSRTETVITTFSARLVTAGTQPADNAGEQGTNAGRSKPYDWVLASKCLKALQAPVLIGTHSFTNGLVVDTRVYTPMTDLAPATYGDSASSNMQHMGVVKDFVIDL